MSAKIKSKSVGKRDNYHYGNLADAIKDLAVELIAEHGVDGFSIRQAAGLLGVASSAVYRHYADKSALLRAICEDGFYRLGQQWTALIEAPAAGADSSPQAISLARFSAGADAYFLFANENPVLFQLMFGPYGTRSSDWSLFQEHSSNNPFTMLCNALDDLQAAKVISSQARENAEYLAFSMVHGISCLAVSGVFRGMTRDQLWSQLALVKTNLITGLCVQK
jgi:AcrR family transcriptional regulator